MGKLKWCYNCGEKKELGLFYKHKNRPDGVSTACKDCAKVLAKKWHNNNMDRVRYRRGMYYQNNKKDINKRRNRDLRNKPSQRIAANMGVSLSQWIRKGMRGDSYIFSYLGVDKYGFVEHMQSLFTDGMSWDNYGKDGWTIDHIIPKCRFDHTKEDELYKCWDISNIQPLWYKDNCFKGDRYEEKEDKKRDTELSK